MDDNDDEKNGQIGRMQARMRDEEEHQKEIEKQLELQIALQGKLFESRHNQFVMRRVFKFLLENYKIKKKG